MVLAGVVAALHVGKLPTALPVLRDTLGVTWVQAGFLLSLVQMAGMLLGIVTGVAADSIGLKRTMVAGLTLLSAASLLGGWASSPAELMVLRAAEGLGFLLATLPAPSLIRRLVPDSRVNAALGMWGAYMPVGTATALLLGPVALAALGWQHWWMVLAGLSGAMAWVLHASVAPPAATASPAAGGQPAWTSRLGRTLAAPGPWLISIAFAAYSGQWLALIGFLPTVYAQAGLSASLAGAATALAALVNMVGNVASGRLLQAGVPARRLLRIGFATMAVGGLLAFSTLPAGWDPRFAGLLRYAGALMFSCVGGLIPGTLFSLAVRLAPNAGTVSTTVGWMQQWSSFGQFAGPPLVAWVASRVGGWQWSGLVTGAFALAGLLLAGRIGRLLERAAP